jgi:hypothetical protein
MYPNAKPSEIVALLGTIDPVSQAAGTVTTGWISAANFEKFLATVQTGVLGASATVDAKLQQATDGTGTGVKDVVGKSITQIVKASGDNKQALINLRADELDMNGGFNFFRLSITVATAASLVSANVEGFMPKQLPGSALNQAGVVQIV